MALDAWRAGSECVSSAQAKEATQGDAALKTVSAPFHICVCSC